MACLYRTFRKDCEAMINFCASEDGRALVVNRFIDEHNHEVSKVHCLHENTNMVNIILVVFFFLFTLVKELFRQLPQQRKLTNVEKEKVKQLLQLKANKKMVKDDLQSSTGKVVLLKDLSNLMTKTKSESTRNNLEVAVKQLTEKHGKYAYM